MEMINEEKLDIETNHVGGTVYNRIKLRNDCSGLFNINLMELINVAYFHNQLNGNKYNIIKELFDKNLLDNLWDLLAIEDSTLNVFMKATYLPTQFKEIVYHIRGLIYIEFNMNGNTCLFIQKNIGNNKIFYGFHNLYQLIFDSNKCILMNTKENALIKEFHLNFDELYRKESITLFNNNNVVFRLFRV